MKWTDLKHTHIVHSFHIFSRHYNIVLWNKRKGKAIVSEAQNLHILLT